MLSDDEDDSDGLGEVGRMSDRMATEVLFWRVVCTMGFPPSEVDGWTLGEMRMACSFTRMQSDYKRIWQTFYEIRNEEKCENGN